ncbi:phosphocarrier protein Hpr [Salmonella bongori]|nr:phosphocarrier protein Hpr [Salmonella bongori]
MLETNNRSYLTVAIGCTGGKHRSVYIAEQLADYFRSRGKNVPVSPSHAGKTQNMTVKQTVEVTNKLGMHARPAMKLFELMQGFDAEVLLRNDEGTEAEANSVIALLMLDSAKGRQIEIEATGPQEVEALAAVIALFNSGFDED